MAQSIEHRVVPRTTFPCRRSGFTLIEILVVVIVLGILGSVVIARTFNATDDAKRSIFIQNLQSFQKGISLYISESGGHPAGADSGVCPLELAPLIDAPQFEKPTPIGGVWDIENSENGVRLGVGVHFNGAGQTRNDAYMAGVDALLDDGNLATGRFRRIADGRYYAIVEELP